jgi:hypothetical protein
MRAAVAEEAARQRRERDGRVHLMLCLIRDDGGGRCGRASHWHPASAATAAQAVPGSGGAAGATSAPPGSGHGQCEADCHESPGAGRAAWGPQLSPDTAATRIQAAARGHLARRRVASERQRRARAAVVIQAGARGMRARLLALELRLEAREQREERGGSGGGGGGGTPVVVGSRSRGRQQQQQGDGQPLPWELPTLPAGADSSGQPLARRAGSSITAGGGGGGGARGGGGGRAQGARPPASVPAGAQHSPRPPAGNKRESAPAGRRAAARKSSVGAAQPAQTIRSIASGAGLAAGSSVAPAGKR